MRCGEETPSGGPLTLDPPLIRLCGIGIVEHTYYAGTVGAGRVAPLARTMIFARVKRIERTVHA